MTPEEIKAERQLIFDTVAKHLAKQGHRATDGAGACFYRAPDGDKCAAGCLILDEEYNPGMEGHTFGLNSEWGHKEIQWPPRLMPHVRLIKRLQREHDLSQEGNSPTSIKTRLICVAEQFGLDASILDTLTFPEVWK